MIPLSKAISQSNEARFRRDDDRSAMMSWMQWRDAMRHQRASSVVLPFISQKHDTEDRFADAEAALSPNISGQTILAIHAAH